MSEQAKFYNRFYKGMMAIVIAIGVALMTVYPATATPMPLANGRNLIEHLVQPKTQQEQATLTLVNRFDVSSENLSAFLDRWNQIGAYMKRQPGFISAELKKDILSDREWIMSEKWSSLEAYKKAIASQDFQTLIKEFPAKASWFAPELFPSS